MFGVTDDAALPPVGLLLVDDEPRNLAALDAILAEEGRELVHAHSAREALAALLERDFAAILLDVHLPDLDGLETARLIRSRERSQRTPILFLTAAGDVYRDAGYELGAVDYLTKPVSPPMVRAKIAVFVELSRAAMLLERQAAALVEKARLEGALLGIRTAEHELGNQLASVTGYLQLALREPDLPPSARARMETALQRARDAAATVQGMRGLSALTELAWGSSIRPTIDVRPAAPCGP